MHELATTAPSRRTGCGSEHAALDSTARVGSPKRRAGQDNNQHANGCSPHQERCRPGKKRWSSERARCAALGSQHRVRRLGVPGPNSREDAQARSVQSKREGMVRQPGDTVCPIDAPGAGNAKHQVRQPRRQDAAGGERVGRREAAATTFTTSASTRPSGGRWSAGCAARPGFVSRCSSGGVSRMAETTRGSVTCTRQKRSSRATKLVS